MVMVRVNDIRIVFKKYNFRRIMVIVRKLRSFVKYQFGMLVLGRLNTGSLNFSS